MTDTEKKVVKKSSRAAATARHQAIADLANQMRAAGTYPQRELYTAADVRLIMAAWQEEYRRRKAAGTVRPSTHSRWRGKHEEE